MKFKIFVRNAGTETSQPSKPWEEDYDYPEVETAEQARQTAEAMISNWNATLRPFDKPRELVSVEFEEEESDVHNWEKQNLYTVMDKRLGHHDVMRCKSCGVTGKRFGLGTQVKLDAKYRAKAYQTCTGAKSFLEVKKFLDVEEKR